MQERIAATEVERLKALIKGINIDVLENMVVLKL
jgi:hypothetical protein